MVWHFLHPHVFDCLLIYDGESSAAALIDGLHKGWAIVARLSLGFQCRPRDSAKSGLLVEAQSRASGKDMEGPARSLKSLDSLQTLYLDWHSLTSAEVLKFMFDINIDTLTLMPQPGGPSDRQPDFRPPFSALSSLTMKGVLLKLPIETLKLVVRGYMERGVKDIILPENYITHTEFNNLIAYLRTLLPLLSPPGSISEERNFNIKVGWRERVSI